MLQFMNKLTLTLATGDLDSEDFEMDIWHGSPWIAGGVSTFVCAITRESGVILIDFLKTNRAGDEIGKLYLIDFTMEINKALSIMKQQQRVGIGTACSRTSVSSVSVSIFFS